MRPGSGSGPGFALLRVGQLLLEEDAGVVVLLLQVALGSLAFLLGTLAKEVAPCSPGHTVTVREEAWRGRPHSQVHRGLHPRGFPLTNGGEGGVWGGASMVGRLSGS